MKIQPKLNGKRRNPRHTAFMKELDRAVAREAARFDVSKSFVIATATAFALGVKEQEDYRKTDRKK